MKLAQSTQGLSHKAKARTGGGSALARLIVPDVWQAGLGDDLRSLDQNSGGDRREQNESGGDGEKLGHLKTPLDWIVVFASFD